MNRGLQLLLSDERCLARGRMTSMMQNCASLMNAEHTKFEWSTVPTEATATLPVVCMFIDLGVICIEEFLQDTATARTHFQEPIRKSMSGDGIALAHGRKFQLWDAYMRAMAAVP